MVKICSIVVHPKEEDKKLDAKHWVFSDTLKEREASMAEDERSWFRLFREMGRRVAETRKDGDKSRVKAVLKGCRILRDVANDEIAVRRSLQKLLYGTAE